MEAYKVPQDVEAEDKLLGPFTFRQFIYLIIVAVAIGIGWGLAQLFIPLAILPLPIVLLFGALALPLRKDQPMETYLAALVSFYIKPHKRLWQPDGIQSMVEITVPKVEEPQLTKDLTEQEAEKRLSYLAELVDTGGWSLRGVAVPDNNHMMRTDVYNEAQQTEDILDENTGISHSLETMISESDQKRREEIVARISSNFNDRPFAEPSPETKQPAAAEPVSAQSPAPETTQEPAPALTFNPYPVSMHQSVIQPLSQQPAAADPAKTSTSKKEISPDIIKLANNSDLSIETIEHEAERIRKKEETSGEVYIPLR